MTDHAALNGLLRRNMHSSFSTSCCPAWVVLMYCAGCADHRAFRYCSSRRAVKTAIGYRDWRSVRTTTFPNLLIHGNLSPVFARSCAERRELRRHPVHWLLEMSTWTLLSAKHGWMIYLSI